MLLFLLLLYESRKKSHPSVYIFHFVSYLLFVLWWEYCTVTSGSIS